MDVVSTGIFAAMPLIEQRLKIQAYFSEDNFRYLVFHGLFKSGIDITRVVLEYPHPQDQGKKQGKKIDTVLLDENGKPKTAIEFKYHRRNNSSAGDSTGSAGELLADFAKLRDFPNVECFAVYLTDGEMLQYFQNPCNALSWVLDPWNKQEISQSNIPDRKTYRCKAGDWTHPALLQMLGNWAVGIDHRLIVWRVKPKPQGD